VGTGALWSDCEFARKILNDERLDSRRVRLTRSFFGYSLNRDFLRRNGLWKPA
jgi:hypothetical protein